MSDPILSLFCGAGGLDIGFAEAGFDAKLAIDCDASAVESYNHNRVGNPGVVADLASLKPEGLLRKWESLSDTPPRGIVGGPPCQGFSVGNAYADPNDPRNLLPYRYSDILDVFAESYGIDFFVFENVPGLLGKKHSARFERIKSRFRKAGFVLHQKEIDAVEFSVPQNRRRLFIVGIRDTHMCANGFNFPEPTSNEEMTVKSAIAGLPRVTYVSRSSVQPVNKHHPNHWTMKPRSRRFTDKDFNNGRSFRRLSWGKPSWTVAYGNREIHVHPSGRRRLSVYEAMLLQGFPDDYELLGSFSAQVDQVSNAVPPPVAVGIAQSIRECIDSTPAGREKAPQQS